MQALAVMWVVKRLYKYPFSAKLYTVSDHQELKSIYLSTKSIHMSPAAIVQKWNLELSAYNFTIGH